MVILRLIAMLTMVVVPTAAALAQDALPTPSVEERTACGKGFAPLYGDVTRKKWLIQHGTGRLPRETCELVGEYSQAELKLIEYFETHWTKCGITSSSVNQMKDDHKKTEAFRDRVCLDAKRWPEGHPVISDFGDPAYQRLGREIGR